MAARIFEAQDGKRDRVPLLIGLVGPSGSGKTYSALRLASGIQAVTGGDIYGIDTEARRMLHYADQFKFKHVQFDPPFGSLDYKAALEQCVKRGGRIIIVDSMSHEHESEGGMLDFYDRELGRLAGDDWAKRERVKMLAWQAPKAARRKLINSMLQLNASIIFCFRAKSSLRPIKGPSGKTEMVPMGYMPISGEEFMFEMVTNILLLPRAEGVPTWNSINIGEKAMIKRAAQFLDLFADNRALDEEIGKALATWAQGGAVSSPAPKSAAATTAPKAAGSPVHPLVRDEPAATDSDDHLDEAFAAAQERLSQIDEALASAAKDGMKSLREEWGTLAPIDQKHFKSALDRRFKPMAEESDKKNTPADPIDGREAQQQRKGL